MRPSRCGPLQTLPTRQVRQGWRFDDGSEKSPLLEWLSARLSMSALPHPPGLQRNRCNPGAISAFCLLQRPTKQTRPRDQKFDAQTVDNSWRRVKLTLPAGIPRVAVRSVMARRGSVSCQVLCRSGSTVPLATSGRELPRHVSPALGSGQPEKNAPSFRILLPATPIPASCPHSYALHDSRSFLAAVLRAIGHSHS